jgi:hypothetical protein
LVEATEKQLVAKIKANAPLVATRFKTSADLSIYHVTRTIQDMTPDHVTAVIVPERERTARSAQQTSRLRIAAIVVILGMIAICFKPEAQWAIVGAVGVLEGTVVFGEFVNREKPKGSSHQKKLPSSE